MIKESTAYRSKYIKYSKCYKCVFKFNLWFYWYAYNPCLNWKLCLNFIFLNIIPLKEKRPHYQKVRQLDVGEMINRGKSKKDYDKRSKELGTIHTRSRGMF